MLIFFDMKTDIKTLLCIYIFILRSQVREVSLHNTSSILNLAQHPISTPVFLDRNLFDIYMYISIDGLLSIS